MKYKTHRNRLQDARFTPEITHGLLGWLQWEELRYPHIDL